MVIDGSGDQFTASWWEHESVLSAAYWRRRGVEAITFMAEEMQAGPDPIWADDCGTRDREGVLNFSFVDGVEG